MVSTEAKSYYPPPESEGGWRWLKSPEEIRSIGGMDPDKLQLACERHAQFSPCAAGMVIVRNGHMVAEWYENPCLATTRFDVWSVTKSFTATAYGILFEDSRQDRLPSGEQIDLDSPVHPFLPEWYPLSDQRKKQITFRHLLTMTSGIPGQKSGIGAIPTDTGVGPIDAALGHLPLKARVWPTARWTSRLLADPGTDWDYSDPAVAHLAVAFHHITGQEIADFLQQRVFAPIGIESLSWDMQGIGPGFVGPHTNAHTGIHICGRELARFGYLMLRDGVWNGQQIAAPWWIELSTQSSQESNPSYGYLWWVNTPGILWPGLPRDAFAARGYNSNACYVIPPLDLVVARVGSGPPASNEEFIKRVVDAVVTG